MTNRSDNPPSRRLDCAGCGTEFSCSLSGPCWCSEEAFRMPMPLDGSDCLCPACLRQAAARASSAAAT
ncbi:cysteine-rich CWC family protein [Bradyrhizobium sp. OAE829]|uniref:cysteine-rich CWC family protein n=1 Tax=Bradyrhizobium sp. OAE829 TaxID=2663807 RepID=UPI0033913576